MIVEIALPPESVRAVEHFAKKYWPKRQPDPQASAAAILYAVLAHPHLINEAMEEIKSCARAGIPFASRMQEIIGSHPEYQGK